MILKKRASEREGTEKRQTRKTKERVERESKKDQVNKKDASISHGLTSFF